jgi:hypothetical protein
MSKHNEPGPLAMVLYVIGAIIATPIIVGIIALLLGSPT